MSERDKGKQETAKTKEGRTWSSPMERFLKRNDSIDPSDVCAKEVRQFLRVDSTGRMLSLRYVHAMLVAVSLCGLVEPVVVCDDFGALLELHGGHFRVRSGNDVREALQHEALVARRRGG
jgi:hypothetical protein